MKGKLVSWLIPVRFGYAEHDGMLVRTANGNVLIAPLRGDGVGLEVHQVTDSEAKELESGKGVRKVEVPEACVNAALVLLRSRSELLRVFHS